MSGLERVSGWWLVVPVKGASGKARLAGVEAGLRSALARAFALDTVRAALHADSVRRVLAVTDDDELAGALIGLGAQAPGRLTVVPEHRAGGLNPAIDRGLAAAPVGHPVAVLQGDLPALTPDCLDAALALAAGHPLAVVPDADGTGTVLLTSRGGALVPRFGPGSCAAHERAGHVVLDVDPASPLRSDVDTAGDLRAAVALGVGPATLAVMAAARPGVSLDPGAAAG